MRRIVSLIIALVLCLGLACPVFAATNPFVPSISYKDGPDIEDAEMDGKDVKSCLIVTTIPQAKNKSTDITQEDRDLLLKVYEELSRGTMKNPAGDSYVIRDLVDVSWKYSACVQAEHEHKEWLEKPDTIVTVDFDLGIGKNADVKVMVYLDGKWVEAERVVNNKNGTVTVDFEDICPVAFCVKQSIFDIPAKTGDQAGQNLTGFVVLMVVSAAAIVALVVLRNKKRKK